MILFVGDKPSARNLDVSIPFVGTKSYKTLLDWIWQMNINITDVKLINKDDKASIATADRFNWKIVVLGNEAEKIVKKFTKKYFKLDHPSGLNRKLNDKNYVAARLKECENWLR
jgi:hypothetical protein